MKDFLLNLLTSALGTVGTILLVFLTPAGKNIVDRRMSRKPVFRPRSPVLRHDLFSIVEPVNSIARKEKRLGIIFNGYIVPEFAPVSNIDGQISWSVNLSNIRDIGLLLKQGTISIQFFFDIEDKSDPITLLYSPETPAQTKSVAREKVVVAGLRDLLLEIRPNVQIDAQFADGVVSKAFPLETPRLQWINEFDGNELQIVGVNNLGFAGNGTQILTEPRYAHVFTFLDCQGIDLKRLTLGHTIAGYCLGGVLRFVNCTDIVIEDCDLFGSGTYGLDFKDCQRVCVRRSNIRDCTYGIMKLANVQDIQFSKCNFHRNKEFDLISIAGGADEVYFKDCSFRENLSIGNLVDFEGKTSKSQITFADCEFLENHFIAFSNRPNLITIDQQPSGSNIIGGRHWLRRRG